VPVSSAIRVCPVGTCAEPIPGGLTREGVCLGHYIEKAFTRVDSALEVCQRGETLEPRMLDWLLAQGDFAVGLLSKRGAGLTSDQRGRLLELLLCLANVRECLRKRTNLKT